MRIKTHWLTGNIGVSLFWEDMINILFRIMQLYSFLFMTYYEFWPSRYRKEMTWWYSFWGGSWFVWSQEMYYDFIGNAVKIRLAALIYILVAISLFMGGIFLSVN